MKTKFKLHFEDKRPDIIDETLFVQSLPENFELIQEAGTFYISIPSDKPEDRKCQFFIDRELDRHFFLTSVKIKAEIVKKQICSIHTMGYGTYGRLDKDIAPQHWNYNLPLQLRLWSIATDSNEILLQVILYFQIIELSYPNKNSYPEYLDSKNTPAPLTECKMLRNIAAHSGDASGIQQKLYCEYLGIPPILHDPTDPIYTDIFTKKLTLLRTEAKTVIERSI